MPDYSKSKIYKMECGELTYIGSTTQPTLARRLAGHKADYKRWCLGKESNCSSFRLFEIGEPTIVLLESVNCNNKDELHRRERYYIESMECVNKCIPTRTQKDWYQDYSEKVIEKTRKYYQANSEKIKEYCQANKDKIKQTNYEYRQANADKIKEKHREYIQANADKIKEKMREYQQANADKIKEHNCKYRQANADKIKEYQREYRLTHKK